MTIVLALILDALMGEPRWLWSRLHHPAVVMGHIIDWADKAWNKGEARQIKGAILVLGLVAGFGLLGLGLSYLGPVVEIVVVAVLVAQRSLADHVAQVATALRMDITAGQRAVGMIVGRDTRDMDEPAIARGAIESAAENLSDGVVAPLFWMLVAGLPGILIYKAINTADSMIGYKTDRHRDFGWAAARLDDVLNLIPARITAACLQLASGRWPNFTLLENDAKRHRSPNAGWPEAAMAGALGIALSGPRSYAGKRKDFAYVNRMGRKDLTASDIDAAVNLLWRAWALLLGGIFVLGLVIHLPLFF